MNSWHDNPSNPNLNAVYVDEASSELSLHPSISFASDGKYILPPFKNPKKVTNPSSLIQINLITSKRVYTTEETITGSLVVACQKACEISSISVYLVGFEQGMVTKQKLFMLKEFKIQGLDSPPNPATTTPSNSNGLQVAKLGVNHIPFSIPLNAQDPLVTSLLIPSDPLPSSFLHPKVGGVKYAVIAVLDYKQSKPKTLACHLPLTVIESVPYRLLTTWSNFTSATERFRKNAEVQISGFMGFGLKGSINLSTTLLTLRTDGVLEPGLWISGSTGHISIKVDNKSPSTITNLTLELIRTIRVFKVDKHSGEFKTHSFSKFCVSKSSLVYAKHPNFSGLFSTCEVDSSTQEWSGIQPFSDFLFQSTIQIPSDAKTIRNSCLIDVSYTLVATLIVTRG
jgi:hypothetical protein